MVQSNATSVAEYLRTVDADRRRPFQWPVEGHRYGQRLCAISNRERALTFYRDVLGFELRSSDGFGDFIQLEGALLRVTVLPDYQVRDIVATVHDPDGKAIADLEESPDSARTGRF